MRRVLRDDQGVERMMEDGGWRMVVLLMPEELGEIEHSKEGGKVTHFRASLPPGGLSNGLGPSRSVLLGTLG